MLPAFPTPIPMPFAQNGERRAIPETNTVPGSADASWATGFPPVTRINKQAGGKPPYGLDFQGLFHDITEHLCYIQAGNLYPWMGASEGQPGLDYPSCGEATAGPTSRSSPRGRPRPTPTALASWGRATRLGTQAATGRM